MARFYVIVTTYRPIGIPFFPCFQEEDSYERCHILGRRGRNTGRDGCGSSLGLWWRLRRLRQLLRSRGRGLRGRLRSRGCGLRGLRAVAAGCGAMAADGCGTVAAAPCEPQMVEQTVMVPTYVTETRMVTATEYKQEQRERTVTVYKQVPQTEQRTQTCTVMVPETAGAGRSITPSASQSCETKTQDYTVHVPYYEDVEQKYTVQVPHYEDVEQKYTVQVPYTEAVEQKYMVQVPYTEAVEQTYTVNVPHQEQRTGSSNGSEESTG